MDIDFVIENEMVFVAEKESPREKYKKRKRTIILAENNLRQIVIDRISKKSGEC